MQVLSYVMAAISASVVVVIAWQTGWVHGALSWLDEQAYRYGDLAPFLTPFVAVAAGLVALFNYRHRRKADNRAEWWQRVQYAIDLILQDGRRTGRNVGMRLIMDLSEDTSATQDDRDMLRGIVRPMIEEVAAQVSSERSGGSTAPTTGSPETRGDASPGPSTS